MSMVADKFYVEVVTDRSYAWSPWAVCDTMAQAREQASVAAERLDVRKARIRPQTASMEPFYTHAGQIVYERRDA